MQKITKNKPKVLFLDWNKTLSHSLFWSQLSEPNHIYGHYHKIITEWLFNKNSHLIDSWMRGEFTAEQICQFIATENALDYGIIWQTLKESCENMSLCSPKIIDLVKNIRQQGIKVIVATDNMDTFRRFTTQGLGLDKIFDDFLVSCDLGVLKYDINKQVIPFFDAFMKTNNLNYEEVVLIDDSAEKSGVYNELGFNIVLIKDTYDLLDQLQKYVD